MVHNQQASQDTESHFYVHPSEGPHSVLISPKFNGSNYIAWSRSMQHALGAKKKLPFINGSLPVPDDDDLNKTAWERCNHLVQSWLFMILHLMFGKILRNIFPKLTVLELQICVLPLTISNKVQNLFWSISLS
jgi:hypothetical protein